MTSGKHLTPEDHQAILKRKEEWPSIIARDMGLHKSTVISVIKKAENSPSLKSRAA